ncbi:MAG: trehalase-like domain-containing protein, partial [Nitrososphaerales archaeon]
MTPVTENLQHSSVGNRPANVTQLHRPTVQWKTVEKEKLLSTYKPISDYGIIGDLKTCALVGIDGSIDWFCAPRFDSSSVFGALLDRKLGGHFQISPAAETFQAAQSYEPLTNILITDFSLDSGRVSLTDFMPCFKFAGQVVSAGEIHRILHCQSGRMDIEVRLKPRFNYGSVVPEIGSVKQVGYSFISPDPAIRQELSFLTDAEFLEVEKGTLYAVMRMKRGDKLEFVLRSGGARKEQYNSQFSKIKHKETKNFWKRWALKCKYEGKWKDQVIRSAL